MPKLEFDPILKFEGLLHAFALIERVAHIKDRRERENDVEHSYFMAMLSWYVVDAFSLPLDKNKVLRYALVHDLVEVYAGDTYIFDEEAKKTKHEREEKARLQLIDEFPEFKDLHEMIEAYEQQADPESKFVKTLDKLEPVIANYMQKGRTWKEMGVTFDEAVEHKREKTAGVPEIRELLEEIVSRIELEKQSFFTS